MWVPLFVQTFAKTWMNGVFKPRQQPPTSTANRRSNITSALSSTGDAINVYYSLSPNSPVAVPLFVFFGIFFECVLCQLTTVLMNDFRLKTFYCKSSSKTSATTASAATTATSALSSSSSLSINKFTPSSNNNHHRTYNNSSKSNKVFLYYTPRDPRLRIFKKTKQFSNRPHQCSRNKVFSNISSRHSSTSSYLFAAATATVAKPRYHSDSHTLSKITDDLCNYGELIGGPSKNSKNITSGVQKQAKEKKQESVKISSVQKILNKFNNCDNSIKESETSDKKCVVAAADIISDTFVVIVLLQRHLAELSNTFSGVFISFFLTIVKPQSKVFNEIATVGLHRKI